MTTGQLVQLLQGAGFTEEWSQAVADLFFVCKSIRDGGWESYIPSALVFRLEAALKLLEGEN